MPSKFPAALDALTTAAINPTPSKDTHPALHNDVNSAVNAIQLALGIEPEGEHTSLKTRLEAIEAAVAGEFGESPGGLATITELQERTAFDPRDYGAKFNGEHDDTTGTQDALDAAIESPGGEIILPPGEAVISTLEYEAPVSSKGGITIRGAGKTATILKQKAGTEDVLLKRRGGSRQYNLRLAHMLISGENTEESNEIGGLDLVGTMDSTLYEVLLSHFNGFQVRFKGGGTQGDTMYNEVNRCGFVQLPEGAAGVEFAPAAGGGSHPDGCSVIHSLCNSAKGTFVRSNAPAEDKAGWLGVDSLVLLLNRTVEVPAPIEVDAVQGFRMALNRFECTSGSMTFDFKNSTPSNFATAGCVSIANLYATYGEPAALVWTDESADGVVRVGDYGSGAYSYDRQRHTVGVSLESKEELVLPVQSGPLVKVTPGGSKVEKIKASWAGRTITLLFTGTVGVEDKNNLKLKEALELGANSTLTLVCDGTNWYEVARSAN